MTDTIEVAIIGEYTPTFIPHTKTNEAVSHAQTALPAPIRAEWMSAAAFDNEADKALARFDALWIAPGSPYKSMQGALNAIRYARERNVPLVGTCAGCQYVVIEYARNVLDFRDAAHAESDPYASNLLVTPLSCSLVGQTMEVHIEPDSRVARIYGAVRISEQYYCNFGVNPAYQSMLHEAGLRIVGSDANGEARILCLPDHPFFVATLFVPQLTSSPAHPHPLVIAFFKAALAHRQATRGGPSRSAAYLKRSFD
jgi:CTP synthase (UTP-ammonia lyase)